ncbi:preprotein translocase subunit SecE [Turicimonas muris]|uniref:preprotein translocase subunit SecE n=2 Tax=Turicimonas muris TaxID=1796652 RepID=UPI0023F3E85B|nr:preprotein translocase subunit SecE [Turicimonas muris]MBS4769347.1 preprotein translocase subunit SecE [Burkholderiales bacterium]
MSMQNAKPVESKSGVALMAVAIVIALSGVFAFALLADQPTLVRVGVLLGCILVGAVIGWFSAPGKEFAAYCKASYEELRRVVWPTRKETVNTTGIVCAFVVVVAFFLFLVDSLIDLALRLLI